ncbi:MAG: hypothetical protein HQL84_01295 [Magnetococcales bacterium]|nr:hypothetical protein [Magnetococcales bacterium]MBF0148663.1 hypothetical protein [Magnetococcales bacterium]
MPHPYSTCTTRARSSYRLATLLLIVMLPLSGCKEVTTSDLEIRKGLAYLKDGYALYSGPVKEFYKNSDGTDGKLMLEGTYSKGLKTDVWTTYGWNGEKSTVKYEEGLEEGLAEEFDTNGMVQRSINYTKGKRHGYSSEYDAKGQIINQVYYRHGFAGRPPLSRKMENKEEEAEEMSTRELEEKLYGKRQKSMIDYIMELF